MHRMNAYFEDLRKKIVEALRRGRTKSETARSFGVSRSSVKRYAKLVQEGRSLAPKKRSESKPKLDEPRGGCWKRTSKDTPRPPSPSVASTLGRVAGLSVSESTVSMLVGASVGAEKKIASIATMVRATSRLGALTRKKEGFVSFQRSVGRLGGRRGAAGRSRT